MRPVKKSLRNGRKMCRKTHEREASNEIDLLDSEFMFQFPTEAKN
jgi:hypothetical protein